MLTTAYLYAVLLQVLFLRTVISVPATLVERSLHDKRAVPPVTFSDFLAGVVVDAPSSDKITVVTSRVVVPEPMLPFDSTGQHGVAAYVGITGVGCTNKLLAGMTFGVSSPGTVTVRGEAQHYIPFEARSLITLLSAFYSWSPDFSGFIHFTNEEMPISPGDTLELTLTMGTIATDPNVANIRIFNAVLNKAVVKTISSPVARTCVPTRAEWIIEDFVSGGVMVPLADFGTITFFDTSATTGAGVLLQPSDLNSKILFDMKKNNQILTHTSVSTWTNTVDSSVTCEAQLSEQI
ncbi:hypothetical protein D9758_015619 [Tetrapyrgos nigripes]|uniref:Uncharacterized protein n=1 Tax=Tetrapyrgos nigripes TaxID=182062 RepID=A0A8H5CM19_9AGAR|nr:hypothetical protein D9758_015619 [Tetrapyrgos nigripes]